MRTSSFVELVASVVRAIPKGQTLSYAGVALRANRPGGARQVVRALRDLKGVPWWRVIKSDGTVAKEMVAKQAPRLRREGVEVVGRRVRPAAWSGGAARRRRAPGSR
jgi:methylated-DNA-protein-cysteine methyltransferase-like protein